MVSCHHESVLVECLYEYIVRVRASQAKKFRGLTDSAIECQCEERTKRTSEVKKFCAPSELPEELLEAWIIELQRRGILINTLARPPLRRGRISENSCARCVPRPRRVQPSEVPMVKRRAYGNWRLLMERISIRVHQRNNFWCLCHQFSTEMNQPVHIRGISVTLACHSQNSRSRPRVC